MVMNNAFSAPRELQQLQSAEQKHQPASWKESEVQTVNQSKEDKPQNSTPTFSERRVKQNEHAKGHHSARQLIIGLHSLSDSSVHSKSNGSRISSGASGEKSKIVSERNTSLEQKKQQFQMMEQEETKADSR